MASANLLERLELGPVICAEGYLFEIERRGYLQAGAFVPEVVLDNPHVVTELHREFMHAGSDVIEAFTYYANRDKLKIMGREGDLEEMNRTTLTTDRLLLRDLREEDRAVVRAYWADERFLAPSARAPRRHPRWPATLPGTWAPKPPHDRSRHGSALRW